MEKLKYRVVKTIDATDLCRFMEKVYDVNWDQAFFAVFGPDGINNDSFVTASTDGGNPFNRDDMLISYRTNPNAILTDLCRRGLLDPGYYQIRHSW